MDQGHDEQPVRAGRDADPFVGDGVVARPDRVHANDLGAAFLQLAQADFDRVAVVILGDTKQHEQFRAIPVGLSELPEGAAHGIDTGGGHVYRTNPAMRRIVRRAIGLREPAGKAL